MNYKLKKMKDTWVCTSPNGNIECRWSDGMYNETMRFIKTSPDRLIDFIYGKTEDVDQECHKMATWLIENHKDLLLKDYRLHISRRIKEERTKANLTQERLADAAGIKRSNLSRIETSKYNMTIDTLGRIADALDLEIDLVTKKQQL